MQKILTTVLVLLLTNVAFPAIAGPAEDVGALLNEYRSDKNRRALKLSGALVKAAQDHAEDMVRQGYFSHKGKDGSTVRKRVTRAGFKGCFWAENIAAGQKTPNAVMTSWANSSGHRKNMLSKQATHFGVGYSNGYWVQVFAKKC